MGETGRLLDNDEVEFLLQGGPDDAPAPKEQDVIAAEGKAPSQEVTMRGDLDKINLSDIFQTLAMSKMEGLLRVRGPIESREIHFRDGFVRCIVPRRVETLRLGHRLVRAGIVTAEHLRSALLEQRKSRSTIGKILVEQQLVTQDVIEEIVSNQLQEDLFSLFTWPQGTFEFYRGEVTDPVVQTRLDVAPAFEVNGVMLEVARRSDDWQRVMDVVGSLDEIVVQVEGSDGGGLDEDAATVWETATGRLTIRDLADATILGLFDCGRHIRELLLAGRIRILELDEAMAVAAELADAGEPRRAVLALRALLERGEALSSERTRRLGDLLARCGESKQAARLLLETANRIEDLEDRLDLARHARTLDRLSADVLEFLATELRGLAEQEEFTTEFADVLADLTDALTDRSDYEEALATVTELEELTGDLALCRPRRARALSKLGRRDEAVESLLGLAEEHLEAGDKLKAASLYEQIVRIDYRRKDVARILKTLHASKLARRGKLAAVAAVLVGLASAGYVQIGAMMEEREIEKVGALVQDALAADQLDRASSLVQGANIRFGGSESIVAMRAQIDAYERGRNRAAAAKIDEIRVATVNDAAGLLRQGRAPEAITAVVSLSTHGLGDDAIAKVLRSVLDGLRRDLQELQRSLPGSLPPPPSVDQTIEEQTELLKRLRAQLASPIAAAARSLHEVRDDVRVRDALVRDHADFVERLEAIAVSRRHATELEEAYASRVERRALARELTPLFHEAREHEQANRFQAALDAYRTLLRNHPEDDELRAHFQGRIERYSTILRFLGILDDATERGDFTAAQSQLRALQAQFPSLPFDSIARLPLRIRTTPPAARVMIDGEDVGESPMLTSYRPAATTRIRIELDGFQPEETSVTGDTVGMVRSLLARLPRWVTRRDSIIDRAPTMESRSRLFTTDRAGVVSCLRGRDGAMLWSYRTGDLSGLLTRPRLTGEHGLVVASIDGELRCLDRRDGALMWSVADLPTESSPVVRKSVIVLATDDARAVGFAPDTGDVRWSRRLPGPVQTDLVDVRENLVVAVTSLGSVVAFDPSNGTVRWSSHVGTSVICAPALDGGELAVAAEDGSVTMIATTTGTIRWTSDGYSTLSLSPCITSQHVLVPDGRELHVLRRQDGQRVRTLQFDSDLSSHLARIDDLVFVGDASGMIRALGTDDLEPRFVLRAEGRALAPVTTFDGRTIIAVFRDRTIRAFPMVGH